MQVIVGKHAKTSLPGQEVDLALFKKRGHPILEESFKKCQEGMPCMGIRYQELWQMNAVETRRKMIETYRHRSHPLPVSSWEKGLQGEGGAVP